jgi:CheY-like chemotaxis protein
MGQTSQPERTRAGMACRNALVSQTMSEIERESPPSSSEANRRVLIVEDDEDMRDVLGELVSALGHEAFPAANGDEALQRASEVPVDVALVDLGLPEVDGYEVARRLRASAGGKGMRLVALTGYSDPETRQNAAAAGFDHFLVKPADAIAIERALGGGAAV